MSHWSKIQAKWLIMKILECNYEFKGLNDKKLGMSELIKQIRMNLGLSKFKSQIRSFHLSHPSIKSLIELERDLYWILISVFGCNTIKSYDRDVKVLIWVLSDFVFDSIFCPFFVRARTYHWWQNKEIHTHSLTRTLIKFSSWFCYHDPIY